MTALFLKIVNTGISAGWVVLAVLAVRLVLRKAPKWTHVLLWGIVALRLIFPPSFGEQDVKKRIRHILHYRKPVF